MRSIISRVSLFIAGLTLTDGCPLALGQSVTEPPDLVSLWTAEGNPHDSVGTNHGQLQGPVAYAAGRVGEAFTFDGSGGRVEIPYSPSLAVSSEATLMAWVSLDELPSLRGQFMYVLGRSQSGNDFDIQVETDDQAKFYVCAGVSVSGTTALRTGTWFHLTATYRAGDRIEVYVNATKEGSRAIHCSVAGSSSPLTIGASSVWGRPWNGRVDQVRLFSRVLSEREIALVYLAEFGVLPKVPLQIRVSQVELCWDTVAGLWYQLQYRSDLTTNLWVPLLSDPFRGTGRSFCTNDSVLPGQPQKYYRLMVTSEFGGP